MALPPTSLKAEAPRLWSWAGCGGSIPVGPETPSVSLPQTGPVTRGTWEPPAMEKGDGWAAAALRPRWGRAPAKGWEEAPLRNTLRPQMETDFFV